MIDWWQSNEPKVQLIYNQTLNIYFGRHSYCGRTSKGVACTLYICLPFQWSALYACLRFASCYRRSVHQESSADRANRANIGNGPIAVRVAAQWSYCCTSDSPMVQFLYEWQPNGSISVRVTAQWFYCCTSDSTKVLLLYESQSNGSIAVWVTALRWNGSLIVILLVKYRKKKKRKEFCFIKIKSNWYYNIYIHKLKLSINYSD